MRKRARVRNSGRERVRSALLELSECQPLVEERNPKLNENHRERRGKKHPVIYTPVYTYIILDTLGINR